MNFICSGIQEIFFLSGEFNNTFELNFTEFLNIQEKGVEFRFRNHSILTNCVILPQKFDFFLFLEIIEELFRWMKNTEGRLGLEAKMQTGEPEIFTGPLNSCLDRRWVRVKGRVRGRGSKG